MHPNDALRGIESESESLPRSLGGEKRFEDASLLVLGNAGTIVFHLHQEQIGGVTYAQREVPRFLIASRAFSIRTVHT